MNVATLTGLGLPSLDTEEHGRPDRLTLELPWDVLGGVVEEIDDIAHPGDLELHYPYLHALQDRIVKLLTKAAQ